MKESRSSSSALSTLSEELEKFGGKVGAKTPFPPPCFTSMGATFLDYESRKSLKVSFPVTEDTLNPQATMQGGFIAAAFDNVFGPLSYLAARGACTTLDLHTQFIRGIGKGETLYITAQVIARGPDTLYMTAEATNSAGKRIATSSTNLLIVRH